MQKIFLIWCISNLYLVVVLLQIQDILRFSCALTLSTLSCCDRWYQSLDQPGLNDQTTKLTATTLLMTINGCRSSVQQWEFIRQHYNPTNDKICLLFQCFMLLWIVKQIGTNFIGDLARGQPICRRVPRYNKILFFNRIMHKSFHLSNS